MILISQNLMISMNNIRMCIVTRDRFPKKYLFKFNLIDGQLVFDRDEKIKSRSMYLVKDNAIIDDIKMMKKFFKICRVEFNQAIIDELKLELTRE